MYRMWDFLCSRMRMLILHFNIRGYRMRILYISVDRGGSDEPGLK